MVPTFWFLNTLFQGKEPGLLAEEGASRAGAGKILKTSCDSRKKNKLEKGEGMLKKHTGASRRCCQWSKFGRFEQKHK